MKNFSAVAALLLLSQLSSCQGKEPEATAVPPESSVPPTEAPIVETEAPVTESAVEALTAEGAVEKDNSDQAVMAGELLDECFVEIPDGIDYECGTVTVPEFHKEDNGRTITLGIIRLLSTADAPAEPMFFASSIQASSPYAKCRFRKLIA